MQYYILDPMPGAEERAVKWEKICNTKRNWLFICYENLRDTSRWTHVERQRKFVLYWGGFDCQLGSYKTLAKAEKAACEFIKSHEEN
jgi:hypothetical protein